MVGNNSGSMGLRRDPRGVQTRICFKTNFQWRERDTCKPRKIVFYSAGGKRIVKETGNRGSTPESDCSRFLQYAFLSQKENRRPPSCYKPEAPQQVSQASTLQNGHYEIGSKSSQKRRFCNINRSEGCIPSHTNFSQAQEISTVLCSGPSVPISSSSIWSHYGSESLHQNCLSRRCLYTEAGSKAGSISRRLASSSGNKKHVVRTSIGIAQSSNRTRFHCQCKEVVANTYSDNNLHRRELQFSSRSSISHRGEAGEDFSSCPDNNRQEICDSIGISPSAWSHGFLHRIDSICQTVHEASSATSAPFLETKIQGSHPTYSMHQSLAGTSQMVVTASKHNAGQIFSGLGCKNSHSNRCIDEGMGCLSREQDSSGPLGSESEKLAYKQSGDGSSSTSNSRISPLCLGSISLSQIRQHDCSSIHQQTGRHKVSVPVLSGLASLSVSNSEPDNIESSPHSGQIEHFAGSVESSTDPTDRMESRPECGSGSILSTGFSNNRSLCFQTQPETTSVLLLDSMSGSSSNRCSKHFLESDVCLCISSNMPHSKSITSSQTVSVQTDFDSSILASETLVPRTVTTISCGASSSSCKSKVTATAKNKHISSKSDSVQSDCLAVINKQFRAKGFSRKVTKLLTASWRTGTQKDYSAKFRKFSSWCTERKVDKYTASLTDCAEFLTSLYHEGLQYRTIAGYRSMLSAVLPPIGSVPVGQHPHIIRLLRGVFNLRPPTVKLLPEWDLPKVLKAIQKYPFEPMSKTSLKYVTYKAVFLTALTTYRRVADLQALRLGEGSVAVQSKGVTFIRHGLSKQDRPGHVLGKIFVPAFSQNKLLDPKRALAIYLRKTEPYRKKKDRDETALFLTFSEPHDKASTRTLARYIVKTIQEVYDDGSKKVKAHSTRAIGPSWALYNGASIKSILEAADWSNESTFLRFYLRDLSATVPNVLQDS